ncbi:MAG TPA: hypothetical protein VHD14_18640 [Pseudolabrys sp.]|jgi:hypothetical protein|nr:hypothetical protein [Pseudolabrys sp.]
MTPRLCLAVLAAALLLAAPAAHAFTFEGANTVTPNGSSNLTDPNSRFDTGGNKSTLDNSNGLHFSVTPRSGAASFDADANRLFSPVGRPGESGRDR